MKNINFTYIDYFFKSYSKHYRNFAAKFQFNAIDCNLKVYSRVERILSCI